MVEYLTLDERHELAMAIMAAVGYGHAQRTIIIGGLPLWLRGGLPGGSAGAPMTDAMLDLGMLSGIERLTDGVIPIKEFLKGALLLAGSNVAADPIRRKLAEIETESTGAAPVSQSPPAEINEKYVTRTAMVPRGFLAGALIAAAAVAKLSVHRYENKALIASGGEPVTYVGTGWLAAQNLMLTNHHVINARNAGEARANSDDFEAQLRSCTVRFDYDDENLKGVEVEAGDLVASDPILDYALFRVTAPPNRQPISIAKQPILAVVPEEATAVNIIQHPDGRSKKWGVRNNLVSAATTTELRYFTDTLNGSSGSPVMNDDWQAVALHRGSKFVTGVRFQGRDVAYVNVGTQLHAILEDLRAKHSGEIPELGI